MSEWFEDRDFWRDCRDVLFGQQRLENAPAEVDWIVNHTGVEPPARVLDLCCGVGRHARAFAERGFVVTGVDLEPAYLEETRRAHEAIETVHSDMRAFLREDTFDLAVNLFTSFGYFDDPADDERVASNVCASLRAGGRFVLEIKGKENLARVFRPMDATALDDGTLVVSRRELVGDWDACHATWILFRDGERREYTFRTRLYAATELRALLQRAGFAKVEFRGSLDGAPLDHEANRTVAIATKA